MNPPELLSSREARMSKTKCLSYQKALFPFASE